MLSHRNDAASISFPSSGITRWGGMILCFLLLLWSKIVTAQSPPEVPQPIVPQPIGTQPKTGSTPTNPALLPKPASTDLTESPKGTITPNKQGNPWKGKIVLPKDIGITFYYQDKEKKWQTGGPLRGLSLVAEGGDDQWVAMRQGALQVWVLKDKVVELSKAVDYFTSIIQQHADQPAGYARRGWAYRLLGKYDEAINDYNEAIRLNPSFAAGWNNRATIWQFKGEFDKAISDYTEAIRLEPKFAMALKNRGDLYAMQQKYDLALKDYDQAISTYENDHVTLNAKAWLLATCPDSKYRDSKKAKELVDKAIELTRGRVPRYIGTLAAVAGERGEYTEALRLLDSVMRDEAYMRWFGKTAEAMKRKFIRQQPYRDEP